MTEMRPDSDSDQAGAESEYGNDTGFAADAVRPDEDGAPASDEEDPGTGAD